MLKADAVIDLAFDALEDTARVIRGQQQESHTKNRNSAYYTAMLWNVTSRSMTKIQAVKQRLKKWIEFDIQSSVLWMVGQIESKEEYLSSPLTSGGGSKNNSNVEDSNSSNSNNATATATAVHDGNEQQGGEEENSFLELPSSLTDEASVQRICDSFSAYKKIAHAATVIFDILESSATTKINIKKLMMVGYRDMIFSKVRDLLFRYIIERVSVCRKKEDVIPAGGGTLKTACRMFSTVAAQFDTVTEKSEYYDRHFRSRYHEHALQDARTDVVEFLRSPNALENLLSWSEERIAFESQLIRYFVFDEGMTTRFSLEHFQRQLQSVFIVPRLEELIASSDCGFGALLSSGNIDKLKQQFMWAVKERPRCPKASQIASDALTLHAKNVVLATCNSFNEQTFDSTADAAKWLMTSMFDIMKNIFTDIINSVVSDSHTALALSRPVRNEISNALNSFALVRNIAIASPGSSSSTTKSATAPIKAQSSKVHFAELFVMYLDSILRDSRLIPTGETIHSLCRNQVSDLFSVMEDRDIFSEYYRLRFSKRLLQTNWEEDNERACLEMMCKIVGSMYTHKFEGMMNDIQQAQTLQTRYFESLSSSKASSSATTSTAEEEQQLIKSLTPSVLTMAYWPQIRRDKEFIPPDPLKIPSDMFERFYRREFPTRQLFWQPERGTSVLYVQFPKGTKEVSMTIYQATVMFAIDTHAPQSAHDCEGVSVAKISSVCGIELAELKPILASMFLAKSLQLVRKTKMCPSWKDSSQMNKIEEDHLFEMNPGFSVRMKKIKLPTATTARSQASERVADSQIEASRAVVLDAAIVRLMKSRKSLKIPQLVEITLQQTQKFFVAQPRDVKRQIEFLISKEYLERSETDRELLSYLA